MSGLERERITIDPDALLQSPRARRRHLAPLIAAAAVLAAVVPVAVLLHHDSSPQPPSGSRPNPPVQHGTDPHRAAIRSAEAIVATAPVPPGATPVDRPPLRALDQPASTPGAQHAQETRFWAAAGSAADAIAYLTAHPPTGMHLSGSGTSGGPGIPTTRSLDFQADEFRSLQYSVVAHRGGIAIRADARVLWAPRRSPADTVPASVTSVGVLVVRVNPQMHQGAPTVRRTLTGADARALGAFVNRLPRAVPTLRVSCPAMFGGEKWYDRLVFHGAGPRTQVLVNLAGCASTTLSVAHRKPIQLSFTYPGVVANVDHRILSALGLPGDYGH